MHTRSFPAKAGNAGYAGTLGRIPLRVILPHVGGGVSPSHHEGEFI